MRNIFKQSLFIVVACLMASSVLAADVTFTMSSIFTGSNTSATVTSPTAATVSTTSSAKNAKDGKLSNEGNYFQVILTSETFTSVTINGYINSNDKTKNWAFQFSTDGGNNWSSEVTQASDGNKSAHDIQVSATIPVNANGFRVIRRAGTSTIVNSITLTLAGGSTPSDPTPVTSVALNKKQLSLKVNASETLSVTFTPTNATNKNLTWKSSDDTKATVDANGKVTGKAVGTANIIVISADNNKATDTCAVTVTDGGSDPTPGPDPGPIPSSDLTTHAPEVYQEADGYNTPIVPVDGREYEVYYVCRDASGNNISIATVPSDKTNGISTGTSTTVKANDNWFELNTSNGKGGDSNADKKDEFTYKSLQCIKIQNGHEFLFKVKGFDQFSFYGKDNNADASKGRYFEVYVDGTKQTKAPIDGYAIHRYDITTGEHLIKLTACGTQDCKLTGFSLRVADIPLVRYKAGPQTQTVYQTKSIEKVTYLVRRTKNYRLVWKDAKAISGITLAAGGGDTIRLQGKADAAVGSYQYTIEALDAKGAVASSESGTITIQTHINDSKNNDQEVNIDEPITPIRFVYYGSDNKDLQLTCDVEGLKLEFVNDSVCTLSGTPVSTTTEGPHQYTIAIKGGNSVTGTITIKIPDPIFAKIADAIVRNNQPDPISFNVIVRHAENVTSTGLPTGFSMSYKNDTVSISGTTNITGPYPKEIKYTLTATPRYAGKQNAQAEGKIIVIDPNAKMVLMVTKTIESANDEPIAKLLQTTYAPTFYKQEALKGATYDAFDLIVITDDVDANNEEIIALIKDGTLEKPILNLKGFTYSPNRLGWGEPQNGSLDTESKNAGHIFVQQPTHPIFKGLTDQKLPILKDVTTNRKGLTPININNCNGSLCLATAYTRNIEDYYADGEMQTIIHEIPRSKTRKNKYICFPLSNTKDNLTPQAQTLLENIVAYLTDENAQSGIMQPKLEMKSFAVEGHNATIDQINDSIKLEMTLEDFKAADSLKAVTPVITLADSKTHVVPSAEQELDLRYTTFLPQTFVVTDYINRRAYTFKLTIKRPEGIEDVYTSGEWVNIFDIYGRKITTTNKDIYTMDLPHGIYIVVTENGGTIKIMK